MQLPVSEELVLVSGCPPIRARKARYFEDPRLQTRVSPPPSAPAPDRPAEDVWRSMIPATKPEEPLIEPEICVDAPSPEPQSRFPGDDDGIPL